MAAKAGEVRRLTKAFWVGLAMICLTLGTIGVFLPLIPTVPFYLATAFCFAKGSERLHTWFLGTSLYEKHLASFVQSNSMTLKTKLSIMASATFMMGVAFVLMDGVLVGRVVLGVVWVIHVLYFVFVIKTRPAEEA